MVKQTVVVTGGAGFIGGHLVELLLQKKYKVIVIDIQKRCKSYFFLNKLDKKVVYKRVDIRKQKQVERFFGSVHPAYVIHLAAQPIVQDAYDRPYDVFDTNIMGTVNILEACRRDKKIKRILVASSDKAYGKTKKTYTESSPLQGDHPYDVSKSCEDLIAYTYFKTYNLPVVITRFGNVYGEGDVHFDRLVPGICESLITKKPFQIRSDGTYVRDYIYVNDVAAGYMTLLATKRDIEGEAFNFSSDDTYSVLKLIKQAELSLHVKIPYEIKNTAKNEIPYQHLNDTKIRLLGWRGRMKFDKVFPKIFTWYLKNISNGG
ncbi:MAG: NAD-dependent epimerase/dehydratase family protein [Candidatus Gottesmanbacteria bacterium]